MSAVRKYDSKLVNLVRLPGNEMSLTIFLFQWYDSKERAKLALKALEGNCHTKIRRKRVLKWSKPHFFEYKKYMSGILNLGSVKPHGARKNVLKS